MPNRSKVPKITSARKTSGCMKCYLLEIKASFADQERKGIGRMSNVHHGGRRFQTADSGRTMYIDSFSPDGKRCTVPDRKPEASFPRYPLHRSRSGGGKRVVVARVSP